MINTVLQAILGSSFTPSCINLPLNINKLFHGGALILYLWHVRHHEGMEGKGTLCQLVPCAHDRVQICNGSACCLIVFCLFELAFWLQITYSLNSMPLWHTLHQIQSCATNYEAKIKADLIQLWPLKSKTSRKCPYLWSPICCACYIMDISC